VGSLWSPGGERRTWAVPYTEAFKAQMVDAACVARDSLAKLEQFGMERNY
jgi:hypothetical protein